MSFTSKIFDVRSDFIQARRLCNRGFAEKAGVILTVAAFTAATAILTHVSLDIAAALTSDIVATPIRVLAYAVVGTAAARGVLNFMADMDTKVQKLRPG